MAETIEEEFYPPQPPSDERTKLTVTYYSFGDRLIVSFLAEPPPGMNVPVGEDEVELRVSLDEQQLLGLEIPNFVHTFLPKHPEFLDFATTAGVPDEIVERIRSDVSITQSQGSAVENLLRQFASVPVSR